MTFKFIFKEKITKLKLPKLTGWIIWTLEKIYDTTTSDSKLEQLRILEKGTVGREVAELLDKKGYRLIPKFENHDLKHILLEYEMTMQDEIKMQAYLVGNGNTTFPCLIFLSLAFFYPITWKHLFKNYTQGKNTPSIHFLTLENCKDKSLSEIKNKYRRKELSGKSY